MTVEEQVNNIIEKLIKLGFIRIVPDDPKEKPCDIIETTLTE